jgi:hypothetical protein
MSSTEFECMHCEKLFRGELFDIGKAYERVIYPSSGDLPVVDVQDAHEVGSFCSEVCRSLGRETLMRGEGVPIPRVRPDIGPVESCAKCGKPVDMSTWHLTYTEARTEELTPGTFTIHDLEYLAVVCRGCRPQRGAVEAETDSGEGPALQSLESQV